MNTEPREIRVLLNNGIFTVEFVEEYAVHHTETFEPGQDFQTPIAQWLGRIEK